MANIACHTMGKQDCVDNQALLKAARFLSVDTVLVAQHASSLVMGCTILKEAKLQMVQSEALLLAVQVLVRDNSDQWLRKNLVQSMRNMADLPSSFLKTCHFLSVLDKDHSIAEECFGIRCLRA